ncbi:MAG: hypothetical protein HWD59_04775 [Coxiellaceae bacterium]|nr:MAG: hypothetical protein HWD59_04775 [Coxiellaceae bacterium]
MYAKYTLAPDYETKLASLTINDFKVSAQAVTVFKKQDNVEYNILQMSQELKQAFEAEKTIAGQFA